MKNNKKNIFIALILIFASCTNNEVKNFKEAYLINKNENYTKRKKIFILDDQESGVFQNKYLLYKNKTINIKTINENDNIQDLNNCRFIAPGAIEIRNNYINATNKKYIFQKEIKGNKLFDIIVDRAKQKNIKLEYDNDDKTLEKYNKNKRHLFIEKKLCLDITSKEVAEVKSQIRKFIYKQNKRQNKGKDDIYKAVGLENIENKENILKQIIKDEIKVKQNSLINPCGLFKHSTKDYKKGNFNKRRNGYLAETFLGGLLWLGALFVTAITLGVSSPITVPLIGGGVIMNLHGAANFMNIETIKEINRYSTELIKINEN